MARYHLFLRVLTFSYQDLLNLPTKPLNPIHSAIPPWTIRYPEQAVKNTLPQDGPVPGAAFSRVLVTAQSTVPMGSQLHFPLTQAESWFREKREEEEESCLPLHAQSCSAQSKLILHWRLRFSFLIPFNVITLLAHWSAFHVRETMTSENQREDLRGSRNKSQEIRKRFNKAGNQAGSISKHVMSTRPSWLGHRPTRVSNK